MAQNPASPLNQIRMLRIAHKSGLVSMAQVTRRSTGIARIINCKPETVVRFIVK